MGIVLITIPGDVKKQFANTLHKRTHGVDLVIVQRPKHTSFIERMGRLRQTVGLRNFPRELWYGFLLRLSNAKQTLEYFREYTVGDPEEYIPNVMEVDSVNSDEVYAVLQKLSPNLIVVWGSSVLAPRILKTANKTINLHMGYCPYYRGKLANQCAVLHEDTAHIGATIHYAEEKVDAGRILDVVVADLKKPPREMFRDLHDRAIAQCLDIAVRLFRRETLSAQVQDISRSENFLFKDWTPTTRYKLAKKMLYWEQGFYEHERGA
ncbi:MAG: Formyl transferase [Parcubacteria group bacterium GW2011_GWA1_47_8]|nr:MAG: Formyl transferase [Parcubacteria group bacterium GW2011_GWA1_47_8]